MAFLMANAAASRGQWGAESAEATAIQAWSLAHGLAMLMLDGQIAPEERLIEAAFGG